MNSPFAGMDPYIEACGYWEGFHQKLISTIQDVVAEQLPLRYKIVLGLRFYIMSAGEEGKDRDPFIPDVSIQGSDVPGAAAAVAEPETGTVIDAYVSEQVREAFIEILDRDDGDSLVTSIEVLSPSNKAAGSKGRIAFLEKREALLLGQTNIVEIDLVRQGTRMPMRSPWPGSPSVFFVCRRCTGARGRYWTGTYHAPLPTIPVPLLRPDPDIQLDLQAAVDHVYKKGLFDRLLDYSTPIKPALPEADDLRLREILAASTAGPAAS